jgi:hypothetical protein
VLDILAEMNEEPSQSVLVLEVAYTENRRNVDSEPDNKLLPQLLHIEYCIFDSFTS